MAKSMRSKREKRLRAIRREMVEPLYDKKEAAKLAAQEAALNSPKLAVKPLPGAETSSMEVTLTTTPEPNANPMDVEMAGGNKNTLGGVGKQSKRQFKVGKRKRGKGKGKGRVKRRHI